MDHTDLDYYRARMAAETLAAECASHPLAAECHLRLAEEYSMLIEANGFRTAA